MIISQSARQLPEILTSLLPPLPEPLLHLNCKQLTHLRISNDDILLNHLPLSKFIILGRITGVTRGTTPRGMAVLNVGLTDQTGHCTIMLYYREDLQQVCKRGNYVKIGVNLRCGGLAYRPEIKLMSQSLAVVQNFGELTEHFLQCMKSWLVMQQ